MLTIIEKNASLDFNDKPNDSNLATTIIRTQSQKAHLVNIANSGLNVNTVQWSQINIPSNRSALSKNVQFYTDFVLRVDFSAAITSADDNPCLRGDVYVSSLWEACDMVNLRLNNVSLSARPSQNIHAVCQRWDQNVSSKYNLHHDYASCSWDYDEGVSEQKSPVSESSLLSKYGVMDITYAKTLHADGSVNVAGTSADCSFALIHCKQINFLPFYDLFNADFETDNLAIFPLDSASMDCSMNMNLIKTSLLHTAKPSGGSVKNISNVSLSFVSAPELHCEFTNVDIDSISDSQLNVFKQVHPFLDIESKAHPDLLAGRTNYRSQSFNLRNIPNMTCLDIRVKKDSLSAAQNCRLPVSYIKGSLIKQLTVNYGGNQTTFNNAQLYALLKKNGLKHLSYAEWLKTGSALFVSTEFDISLPNNTYVGQSCNMSFDFSLDLFSDTFVYEVQVHQYIDSNLEISSLGTTVISAFTFDDKMEKQAIESGAGLQVSGGGMKNRGRGGSWWNKVKNFVSGVARGVSNVASFIPGVAQTVGAVANNIANATSGSGLLKSGGFTIEKRKAK